MVVGAGAIVLGAITVGDNARIGAGAVVVRPVPAAVTVVGQAARVLEQRLAESGTFTRLGEQMRRLDPIVAAPAMLQPRRRASVALSSPICETRGPAQTVRGGNHARHG